MKRETKFFSVMAISFAVVSASCGGLFESAIVKLNIDSVVPLEDPALCSLVYVKNQVRTAIYRNGDSVQDTSESREAALKPIGLYFKIYNGADHQLHREASVTSASAEVAYGDTVELRVEFDPAANPEALVFPYFTGFFAFDVILDGFHTESSYVLDVQQGEGHCGSTYYYTAWNTGRDSDKLLNSPGKSYQTGE